MTFVTIIFKPNKNWYMSTWVEADNIKWLIQRSFEMQVSFWFNRLDKDNNIIDKYYYVDRGHNVPLAYKYFVFNSNSYCYLEDIGSHNLVRATKTPFPEWHTYGDLAKIIRSLVPVTPQPDVSHATAMNELHLWQAIDKLTELAHQLV